ncbi:MAG: cation-translocating P-type ATPase [Verrucomicrobiota bacterium]
MTSGCCACDPSDSFDATEDPGFWIRFGIAAVLAGQGMVFGLAINLYSPSFGSATYWVLHGALMASALAAIALLGPKLIQETVKALRETKVTVEALFLLTCAGALVGSLLATFTGVGSVYYEVVAIVLAIYSIGKRTSAISKEKVLQEIKTYRETFDTARQVYPNGEERVSRASLIEPGSRVRVAPGEAVPVDGTLVAGEGFIEQSQLTGEPVPTSVRLGGNVFAGSWSVDGTLLIEVTKRYGNRRIDQILTWVEDARGKPSELQSWADKTIRWFLPVVAVVSFGTFLFWFWQSGLWNEALFNAMAVLLVACPCALGLATPIAVWKGLFRLTERGLLCRHGDVLDTLAKTQRIFFDKTGTLSSASLTIVSFEETPENPVSKEKLQEWIAAAETGQEHPVAKALSKLFEDPKSQVTQRTILPGRGLESVVQENDLEYHLLISPAAADPRESKSRDGKVIHVLVDGILSAKIQVEESLRDETSSALAMIKNKDIAVEILSGDPDPAWTKIEGTEVVGSLSAEEKKKRVEASRESGERPVFVGDGINDTPAMAAASTSIAINEGASLARGTSDAVLLGNNLNRISEGIDLSRKIHRGVHSNIRFAIIYNAIGILLAATGILHPVAAALLMLASSATVSIRALLSAEPRENS